MKQKNAGFVYVGIFAGGAVAAWVLPPCWTVIAIGCAVGCVFAADKLRCRTRRNCDYGGWKCRNSMRN